MCLTNSTTLNPASLVLVFIASLAFVGVANAQTQTQVYLQNDSSSTLIVKDIVISGDKLNKKAWKAGATTIPPGDREKVLTINRSGKLNWMDPTPRFIEPGKTVVFSTVVALQSATNTSDFQLKQKLLGTGKATRMWHAVNSDQDKVDWVNDAQNYLSVWLANEQKKMTVDYRIFKEKSNTHIEYIFSDSTD